MLKVLKSISFHPKFAAVLDLVINLVFLWLLRSVNSWTLVGAWLFLRILIWFIFVWLVYYPKEMSRFRHLCSLISLTVGSLAFLLFIEWKDVWFGIPNFGWYLLGALFCMLSFFSFWLLPASAVSLTMFLKPHLRWRFIMSAVGLAGIFEGAQAIISFQITTNISSWVWLISASFLATVFALWWWWEYNTVISHRFWIWGVAWFLLMLELFWALNLLPLGYLVSSLILIWCWYVAWLMVRFHLTAEGVNWKKQIWFLSANAVLFIVFLIFIVRWK